MLDRFGESAISIICAAQRVAQNSDSSFVEPEHFLLGTCIVGVGSTRGILLASGFDCDKFNSMMQNGSKTVENGSSDNIPLSAQTNHLLEQALVEAQSVSSKYVSAEHILIALLQGKYSGFIEILDSQGIDSEKLLETLADSVKLNVIKSGIVGDAPLKQLTELELIYPFDDKVMYVLNLSSQAAQEFGLDTIETHHILFGLVKEENNFLASELKELKIGLDSLQEAVSVFKKTCLGDQDVNRRYLSRRANRVLQLANALKEDIAVETITCDLLAYALLTEEYSAVVEIIERIGVDSDSLVFALQSRLGIGMMP